MSRVRNVERLKAIWDCIDRHPGIDRWGVARVLGLGETNIEGYLASMESVGLYLSEDLKGGLYTFAYYPGNVLSLFSGPI